MVPLRRSKRTTAAGKLPTSAAFEYGRPGGCGILALRCAAVEPGPSWLVHKGAAEKSSRVPDNSRLPCFLLGWLRTSALFGSGCCKCKKPHAMFLCETWMSATRGSSTTPPTDSCNSALLCICVSVDRLFVARREYTSQHGWALSKRWTPLAGPWNIPRSLPLHMKSLVRRHNWKWHHRTTWAVSVESTRPLFKAAMASVATRVACARSRQRRDWQRVALVLQTHSRAGLARDGICLHAQRRVGCRTETNGQ
ncbi:hypothetical protein CTA1_12967 [Colletotrichum tanaceti]|uniref:Uncharacterized protein n=1 Tax=Colletotrichum tanaceti TaxID=1306861 RepID=A0A4U6X009_9PEZI|nr:hypothetical protein CTA1_12967 [Colletotrichum tanaceti]